MILIDSSAWIEFLSSRVSPLTDAVAEATRTDTVIVGDLVLTEVLQGIRNETDLRDARRVLFLFPMRSLCDPQIAEQAADHYRFLRRRGITVRGTIDVIIATWCIVNQAVIIHNDRDMAMMETELGLRAYV